MQTFLDWCQQYHVVLIYGLVFLLLHFIILRGLKRLKQFLEPLALEAAFTQKIFSTLKHKIYLLWIFFILWILSRAFPLFMLTRIFKSITSFILCLILGDVIGFFALLCFKGLIKDVQTFYPLLQKILLFIFSIIGCVVAANNLGYSLSGFLTTLGIGGAALALASQSTIANLWASLCILLDHPFQKGDWIAIGTRAQGRVKAIGLRSTRLCNEQGNIIVIPNSIVINECIENIKDKKPK